MDTSGRALFGAGTGPSLDIPNPRLSYREDEAIKYLAEGMDDDDIGRKMGISPRTARFHIDNLRKKLNAKNRAHLVALAFSNRIIEPQGVKILIEALKASGLKILPFIPTPEMLSSTAQDKGTISEVHGMENRIFHVYQQMWTDAEGLSIEEIAKRVNKWLGSELGQCFVMTNQVVLGQEEKAESSV